MYHIRRQYGIGYPKPLTPTRQLNPNTQFIDNYYD
ncbi:hypothetical protein SPLC1_S521170 [Arthrospira platensis C1]|nr:hypothetical protein SPLC1_S521170 [Arthrospira platensis C1]